MKTTTRKKTAAPKSAATSELLAVTLPALGTFWPEHNGTFVGIRKLGDNDAAVIVPNEPESDIAPAPWKDAIAKAGAFKTRQHQDFVAADRVDLYLAYTHAPQLFKKEWYWSATPCAGNESYAWFQSFYHGSQFSYHKGYVYRARAVRRVILR